MISPSWKRRPHRLHVHRFSRRISEHGGYGVFECRCGIRKLKDI